ncbi:TD and POZ domain-containing protein 4 [Hordeum vulgare]|nr:TD and POZ domain-containing protein 4 [Hordeum vulgare]
MCHNRHIAREALEKSKHLKGDSFTIRYDLVVIGDAANSLDTAAASPFINVPPSDMQKHFRDLLLYEEGTDVTFQVSGETIAAHRCVLAARSTVFKAELFGAMKEGTDTTSVIQVDGMDAQVFRAMLGFIYGDSLPETEEEKYAYVMWQHLLIAADRYDLGRLRLMCEEKLSEYVDVTTATAILMLAEQHSCGGLKKTCLEFLNSPANLQNVMDTGGLDSLAAVRSRGSDGGFARGSLTRQSRARGGAAAAASLAGAAHGVAPWQLRSPEQRAGDFVPRAPPSSVAPMVHLIGDGDGDGDVQGAEPCDAAAPRILPHAVPEDSGVSAMDARTATAVRIRKPTLIARWVLDQIPTAASCPSVLKDLIAMLAKLKQ